jgi:protoporphyrinogen IX oxidase
MDLLLLWLHVVGNIVWVGSILAVGVIVAGPGGEPKVRGEIALRVYMRLAVPAFVLSFVCGTVRLASDPSYYLKQHHWMHAKLPLALGVIALHHVLGGRAKKLARGTVQDGGPAAILTGVLALAAVGAAFFAIFKVPV